VNVQALADLVGVKHVLDENTVTPKVQARLRTLTRMLVFAEAAIAQRHSIGKPADRELWEVEALKWALRVLTHPDVQATVHEQVVEDDA